MEVEGGASLLVGVGCGCVGVLCGLYGVCSFAATNFVNCEL